MTKSFIDKIAEQSFLIIFELKTFFNEILIVPGKTSHKKSGNFQIKAASAHKNIPSVHKLVGKIEKLERR